jgi:catechol 2,3-dioxygenase-like lactoylglutathione lyase family enzyme
VNRSRGEQEVGLVLIWQPGLRSVDIRQSLASAARVGEPCLALSRRARPREVNMSSTDVGTASSTAMAEISTIDMGLEVVTVPVSDVDRAKRFYQSLGWRVDIDIDLGDFRQVQMTPPRSQTSIHFGKGITGMEPGCLEKLYLAVKDIDAAREDLVSRGVDVSEVEEPPKPPGFDLPGRSYFAYASFRDPDGNSWLLQEVTTRVPGRGWDD